MSVKDKAIKVAIRYHFCGIHEKETEIYETLVKWVEENPDKIMQDYEDTLVWNKFEHTRSYIFLNILDDLIFLIETTFPEKIYE